MPRKEIDDSEPIDDEYVDETPSSFSNLFSREGATSNGSGPDSMTSLIGVAVSNIHWKVAIFIFILVLILWSDVFVEGVLGKMSGMINGQVITRQGTVAQAIVMSLSYVLFSFFVSVGAL